MRQINSRQKSGFDSVKVQYDACRCTAYDEASSYLGFWADPAVLGIEGQTELSPKFTLITSLYFEQKEFLKNPWSVYTIETRPISELTPRKDFINDIDEKLYKEMQ